jgi:putative hydrolase
MNTFAHLTADLHVHTLASGHAFSTVNEIASEARAKGLELIGLTDHGPALPGAPQHFFFACLGFIPEFLHGVRILRGIEANIIGKGGVDLPDAVLKQLDFALAGFHDYCGYAGTGIEENTQALITVMRNPLIRGISHPGNPKFPIDYIAVLKEAAQTGTAIEINNASFIGSRRGSEETCREIAALCVRYEVPVMINSDAHIAQTAGEVDTALRTAREAGVAWEQIVNRNMESALRFLGLDH